MKKILLVIMLLFLTSCDLEDEFNAYSKDIQKEKVWVFAEFALTREDEEIDSYYYYGKASKSLYDAIKANQIHSGFISLDDVRYWNQKDIIVEYADEENVGEIVFRIEDIARIILINTPPVVGKGYEQYEEDSSVIESSSSVEE